MFLPGWLNLDSLSVIRLAALLLSLVISAYLTQVRRKSFATLCLAGVFLGAFLFHAASFFELAGPLSWHPNNARTVVVTLASGIGPSLAMIFLLLFAYHFPRFRRSELREFRIVFAVSVAMNAGMLGLNIYDHFILQWRFSDMRLWNVYWLSFYCCIAIQFLGATVLLFRRARRLAGRDADAAKALGAVLLLPLIAVGTSLAVTYSALPFSVASSVTWLGLLLFYLVFVVTYLNHSVDPLTLQVKLIGVTLVLALSAMGLVALFVGETSAQDCPRPALPQSHSSIRFTLNRFHCYDISRAPGLFDPDVGPRADLAYGRSLDVTLEFDFPFFASSCRRVRVLGGPLVLLGEGIRETGWGGYNPQPAIAPLILNLDPSRGQGVHVKSSPDAVTITWLELPELEVENANTIQLVLRANGSFDMRYEEISPLGGPSIEQQSNYAAASVTGGDPSPGARPARFPPRLTGIHPGGASAPLEAVNLAHGLPWSGNRPAVIFDSYEAVYSSFLNARIGVLVELTAATSVIILLLIPLLLRATIFFPLRILSGGMRRVEDGDLGAAVTVRSRDEIGSLARSFNHMVGGLRERFELTKYVSAGTIDAVKTSQAPQRVLRTLLFTDVRGFTFYTEQRTPEHVVRVLNRLLDRQSEIIQRFGGDIDKFVGDEIVAVFSGDEGVRSACTAALCIARLCAQDAAQFERLTVGMGIACGAVIQGMVGSARRADFTVIGDPVNLASRLCSIAHGMHTVVSDTVRKEAERHFRFAGPYSVRIKGKAAPQLVWSLIGPTSGAICG